MPREHETVIHELKTQQNFSIESCMWDRQIDENPTRSVYVMLGVQGRPIYFAWDVQRQAVSGILGVRKRPVSHILSGRDFSQSDDFQ